MGVAERLTPEDLVEILVTGSRPMVIGVMKSLSHVQPATSRGRR